jgi:hypothetical protein
MRKFVMEKRAYLPICQGCNNLCGTGRLTDAVRKRTEFVHNDIEIVREFVTENVVCHCEGSSNDDDRQTL